MFASMAKCFAADHAQKCATDAIQVYGTYCFSSGVRARAPLCAVHFRFIVTFFKRSLFYNISVPRIELTNYLTRAFFYFINAARVMLAGHGNDACHRDGSDLVLAEHGGLGLRHIGIVTCCC